MNRSHEVLRAVRAALRDRPAQELPATAPPGSGQSPSWSGFAEALAEAQGTFVGPLPRAELAARLQELTGGALRCAGSAAALLEQPALALPAAELDGLPWVVARGFAAVASTGSVAVDAGEVPIRMQLVLPEHLALLVPADALVEDLPQLYDRLDRDALAGGYLTLISGPSKTADIELELVTGAHGPRSLTVLAYHDA